MLLMTDHVDGVICAQFGATYLWNAKYMIDSEDTYSKINIT
jgi:hypothetical protein